MTTKGKQVTLPVGAVVVDVGPAVVNGQPDERVRMCVDKFTGEQHRVIARVIADLPVTHNRADL